MTEMRAPGPDEVLLLRARGCFAEQATILAERVRAALSDPDNRALVIGDDVDAVLAIRDRVQPTTLPEGVATHTVTIEASGELLAEMRDRWSDPVQVMATVDDAGLWSFVFRRVPGAVAAGPSRVIARATLDSVTADGRPRLTDMEQYDGGCG